MEGMKRAREIASLLSGTAPVAAPSPALRRRILASVGVEPRRFGWAPFLAAALGLALFAAIYFNGRERDLGNELARLRDENRQQNIELTRVNEAFAILNGPDTTVTTFGEGQPKPKGRVFLSPSQGVLLIASNLPPAAAGKAYEMWIIPKGGPAEPAGTFQSDAGGSAMHLQRGPVDPNADLVAVTLEDLAGAPQPTTTPLFAAQVHVTPQ